MSMNNYMVTLITTEKLENPNFLNGMSESFP